MNKKDDINFQLKAYTFGQTLATAGLIGLVLAAKLLGMGRTDNPEKVQDPQVKTSAAVDSANVVRMHVLDSVHNTRRVR